MISLFSIALAHHGTALTQVVPEVNTSDAQRADIVLSLPWNIARYVGFKRGAARYPGDATVTLQTLTPTVTGQLPSGTGLTIGLPLGWIAARTDGLRTMPQRGPGDLFLLAHQQLGPFSARLGVTAPTGRYTTAVALSTTDVAGKAGTIVLTTYDTRTSLGAGSWSTSGDLTAQWERQRVRVSGEIGVRLPIHRTRDGVLWGATFHTHVQQATRLGERMQLNLSADIVHHRSNRLPVDPEESLERQRVGQRTSIGAAAGVAVELHTNLHCGAQLRLPIWQHVQGVQLTKQISGGLSCSAGFSFHREPGESSSEQ